MQNKTYKPVPKVAKRGIMGSVPEHHKRGMMVPVPKQTKTNQERN